MNRRFLSLLFTMACVVALRLLDPWPVEAIPAIVAATPPQRTAANGPFINPQGQWQSDSVVQRWPVRGWLDSEPVDIFALPKPASPAPRAMPIPAIVKAPAPVQIPRPPSPPPTPTAPPIPFVVVGDWTESTATAAFLSGPQGTILVRAGDRVGGAYRVDEISSGVMRLTYLPLNQTQQLTWSTGR